MARTVAGTELNDFSVLADDHRHPLLWLLATCLRIKVLPKSYRVSGRRKSQ